MTIRPLVATWLAVLSLLGMSGCQSCHQACAPNDGCTARYAFPRLGLFRSQPAPAPVPAPLVVNPPPPQPVLQSPIPQNPGPVDYRGYEPLRADSTWHPPTDSRNPASVPGSTTPGPINTVPPRDSFRLLPPEPVPAASPEPPKAAPIEERNQQPAVSEDRSRSPSLPVGIPQFAAVREGIAAGLKPSLDGGLDWLQANGYRTVLHVRQPGEDHSADRREVEKRGLKYLSLEVSPTTLSKAKVEEFSRIIGDQANYPLFVYDKDGTLAGGLWYLHFRLTERDTDEAARANAARLGLKDSSEGNHRATWLAIQKLLGSLEK